MAQCEQGSQEWLRLRLGKFTASCAYRLMAEAKRPMTEDELLKREKGSRATTIADPVLLAKGALTYVQEVASERLTGVPAKVEFENDAMRHGKLHEPTARALYAAVYGREVDQIDFVPYLDYAGASPDGLVGLDIGCEIKCPISPAIHLLYRTIKTAEQLKDEKDEHYWQTMQGMLSTGRKMWHFISYHPSFPVLKQLHVVDVPWNDQDIDLLKIKLEAANKAATYLETV